MNDIRQFVPSTPCEAWHVMNRVYYYLRNVGAPREARTLVNGIAQELFEEMFQEVA